MFDHLYLCCQCGKDAAFYRVPEGLMYCRVCQLFVSKLEGWHVVDVVKKVQQCSLCHSKDATWTSTNGSSYLCDGCTSTFPSHMTTRGTFLSIKTAVVVDISNGNDEQFNILPLIEVANSLGWAGNAVSGICWKNQSTKLLHLQIEPSPVHDMEVLDKEVSNLNKALKAAEEECQMWKNKQNTAVGETKEFMELWRAASFEAADLSHKNTELTTQIVQLNLQVDHLVGETKSETIPAVTVDADFGSDRE